MTIRRSNSQLCGKVGGEPLFYNPFIKSKLLDSFTLQQIFCQSPSNEAPWTEIERPTEECCETQSGDWHPISTSTDQYPAGSSELASRSL